VFFARLYLQIFYGLSLFTSLSDSVLKVIRHIQKATKVQLPFSFKTHIKEVKVLRNNSGNPEFLT